MARSRATSSAAGTNALDAWYRAIGFGPQSEQGRRAAPRNSAAISCAPEGLFGSGFPMQQCLYFLPEPQGQG